jgi:hypothetical protein
MARNFNDAFPSKYLKASDLGGRKLALVIEKVEEEQVGREREHKPVAYFQGKQKGLVLNKTNCKKIASIVGSPDMDTWPGAHIGLYETETEMEGETVACIRIAAVPATGKPAPAPPPPPVAEDWQAGDEDVPFSVLLAPFAGFILAGLALVA